MNVLVLCGDRWHPAEIIKRGLSFINGHTLTFVEDAKDSLTPDALTAYQVIINCKSDNLTQANDAPWFEKGVTEVGAEELCQYIQNGGGLLALHAGVCYLSADTPEMVSLLGSEFVTHPPRCQTEVHVCKRHPITEGVSDFSVRDEHYQLANLASDADLFLQSISESGGTQIAGYVRTIGKGRLCAMTPGHILSVWQEPCYQRLVSNAINWCGGLK